MSPADRNKILIAGGIVVVAVIVVVFVLLRGRGAGEPASGTGEFVAAAPSETPPEVPGAPPPPGAEQPEEAAPAEEAGQYYGAIKMGTGSAVLTRRDPTETFEPPPQPPPPELVANLPSVNLQEGGLRPPGTVAPVEVARPLSDLPVIALQQGGLRPPGVASQAEVGRRRVAGLLVDDRAWAILEAQGETFIVKPGDSINGYLVTAISRDSVFLTDERGRRWQVPLRGAGLGAGGEVSGMPGLP